jgi:site-specific recombinase XerD
MYQRRRLTIGFNQWLSRRNLGLSEIKETHCAQYLSYRARGHRAYTGDRRSLTQLLRFLLAHEVIAPDAPITRTPAEQCVHEFARYLREERLLSSSTLINYSAFIEDFLAHVFGARSVELEKLTAQDVVDFVRRQAPRLTPKRSKLLTCALRSFLRYGNHRGDVHRDLEGAVPVVANWSRPLIPRAIGAAEVRRVLEHVDRTVAVGRRDYAILLLLARLGLRASEIVNLELQDIDWKASALTVQGKRGRRTQLPLPPEVAEAIVDYLKRGRPKTAIRRVFLCADAPVRGLQHASTLCDIVRRAVQAAGVDAPTLGAHQFRHGLASEMLRRGASMREIGELLGHRSPETTKIYAKVDVDALRTLALPWPIRA